MGFRNQVQLITYPDSLGGDLKALHRLLSTHLAGLFPGGVHILPFFPSSADRGFAPMTYLEVEPAFGDWAHIRRIAADYPLVADLMVNHISRQSRYFQDFARRGRGSEYADLFITLDKIWPDGHPPAEDVAEIFLRKPEHPFSDIIIQETGETERLWTSFGVRDWSEQIDLDVHSAATRELLTEFLVHLGRQGIKIVRLDAVGYVIKKPGTSCFFVEPEIYDFMDWIRGVAASADIEILPEVHAHYSIQFRLAAHGFWVYDFVLPMLILHTLLARDARKLADYLRICPRRQVTMLDCHDGIPVQPDVDDILTLDESKTIVDRLVAAGANLNRLLSSEKRHGDFDAHQINCTYYSALEADDDAYLTARHPILRARRASGVLRGPAGRRERLRCGGGDGRGAGHQPAQLQRGGSGVGGAEAGRPAPDEADPLSQRLSRFWRRPECSRERWGAAAFMDQGEVGLHLDGRSKNPHGRD